MFYGKKLKKLKKKVAYLTKVSEANNEFLAQIHEVMITLAQEEDQQPTPIGFKTTNKDD